jgi:hypothetical protein
MSDHTNLLMAGEALREDYKRRFVDVMMERDRLAARLERMETALCEIANADGMYVNREYRSIAPDALKPTDSADAGLRQLQRESEDLGLYEPQSAHQHWPGQAQCEWCKGTGAIDAPTSADDPSCPNCDGEGRWEK